MADFPALPLFTDAYMADTRHLTVAENGAYLLLLMTAWRSEDCGLPDDDIYLGRAIGDPKNWPKYKKNVLAFFIKKDGRLYQKRLLRERDFVTTRSAKNRSHAQARWLKTKETGYATAMPNACQTDAPTPTPTPTPITNNLPLVEIDIPSISSDAPSHMEKWIAKISKTKFMLESPTDEWIAFAKEYHPWITDSDIKIEFENFRDYRKNKLSTQWLNKRHNVCQSQPIPHFRRTNCNVFIQLSIYRKHL